VSATRERLRLDGQHVLVTGAGRGLGAACAVACAQAGAARVALLARTPGDLAAVAERVEQAGASAQAIPCDVTSSAALTAAFEQVERVDVLVNAAGTNRPEPFEEVEEETYDRLFAVNVRASFFATQRAVRRMRARGCGGAIVSLSSQMGHVGAERRTVYCATKHALEGLTKALAVELAPDGIRVVTVAPTFVRTEMTAAQLDDPQVGPNLRRQIPLGRWGTLEDVADAVVFAASPAASLMTGTSLVVDGGWTAR
jgi:NAD(P)-dependent dehydrogenase (short-subunit alcohol dehydrogenase family)